MADGDGWRQLTIGRQSLAANQCVVKGKNKMDEMFWRSVCLVYSVATDPKQLYLRCECNHFVYVFILYSYVRWS